MESSACFVCVRVWVKMMASKMKAALPNEKNLIEQIFVCFLLSLLVLFKNVYIGYTYGVVK